MKVNILLIIGMLVGEGGDIIDVQLKLMSSRVKALFYVLIIVFVSMFNSCK